MKEWFSELERISLNNKYYIESNTILDSYMKFKRKKRPILLSEKKYELYESDGLIQLWFQTPACRFSTLGKCTMCNYWSGNHITDITKIIASEVKIISQYRTLLINTCGSCLDQNEVSIDDLIYLLDWISHSSVESVIFESHWTTLTDNVLKLINSKLTNQTVYYEMGIESTNYDSLYYFLNKPSSLIDVHALTNRIHSYNAKCIMNVILGVPFLNPEEQLIDAIETIRDLLDNGADYLVIFPINIKPYTLIMDLYKRDEYVRVPAKIISNLLLENFSDSLSKINIAWFGDRLEENVIPPASCIICERDTIDYFKQYNEVDDDKQRQELLKKVSNIRCDCIDQYMSYKRKGTLFERINQSYDEIIEVIKSETT